MKNECNIVRDLLPLYKDEVCSDDSKAMVQDHLSECNNCKEYYNNMNDDIFTKTHVDNNDKVFAMSFKKVKNKLLKKNIIISLCSIVLAVILLLFIQLYQMPIEYDENLFSIEQAEDGVIDITFTNDDYYSAYSMTREIVIDGIKRNITYIYFSDTIWTKLTTSKGEPSQFSIGTTTMVDYSGEGDTTQYSKESIVIYYLCGNYSNLNQLTDEAYINLANRAIKLWED